MKMLKLNKEDSGLVFEDVMMYSGEWAKYNDTANKEVIREINICSADYDFFIGENSYGEHTLYRNKNKHGDSE